MREGKEQAEEAERLRRGLGRERPGRAGLSDRPLRSPGVGYNSSGRGGSVCSPTAKLPYGLGSPDPESLPSGLAFGTHSLGPQLGPEAGRREWSSPELRSVHCSALRAGEDPGRPAPTGYLQARDAQSVLGRPGKRRGRPWALPSKHPHSRVEAGDSIPAIPHCWYQTEVFMFPLARECPQTVDPTSRISLHPCLHPCPCDPFLLPQITAIFPNCKP